MARFQTRCTTRNIADNTFLLDTHDEGLQTWIVSQRIFCQRCTSFKIKCWRSLEGIRTTDVCSNFSDVQEQSAVVSHSSAEHEQITGRGFEKGRHTSNTSVGLRIENIFAI